MSQSNRDRILQIAQWLSVEFPTPFPVTVKCVKKIAAPGETDPIGKRIGYLGETYRDGRKITIRIAVRPGLSRASINDCLLHEWAHAATLRHDVIEEKRRVGGHDDEWALMYGRIYRKFVDDGGSEASKQY